MENSMKLDLDSRIHNFTGKCLDALENRRLQGEPSHSQEAVILNYHQVCPLSELVSLEAGLTVEPETFREQVAFLSDHCSILTFGQLGDLIAKSAPFPPNALVITFDDGYLDNFQYAFPILKEYNAPATFFVTTDFVDQSTIAWWDELALMLRHAQQAIGGIRVAGVDIHFNLSQPRERVKKYNHLMLLLKTLNPGERRATLQKLHQLLQPEFIPPPRAHMNWDEIRQVAKWRIEIGSHTRSHPILSQIAPSIVRQEVEGSKMVIENHLQSEVKSFAYPNGQETDFNHTVIQILKDVGYQQAGTTMAGVVTLASNPFILERMGIRQKDSQELFRVKTAGTYPKLLKFARSRLGKTFPDHESTTVKTAA
jgi:peptidoglycan/xylan/chitin deacetylase (PgdA/CDA1 family)